MRNISKMIIINDYRVATLIKDNKIYACPITDDLKILYGEMIEVETPESQDFLDIINNNFQTTFLLKDFENK